MTTSTSRPAAHRAAAKLLARQDRIDVWALPWQYLAIVGTGYFFTGYFFTVYDITDIGFAMPQIQTQSASPATRARFWRWPSG